MRTDSLSIEDVIRTTVLCEDDWIEALPPVTTQTSGQGLRENIMREDVLFHISFIMRSARASYGDNITYESLVRAAHGRSVESILLSPEEKLIADLELRNALFDAVSMYLLEEQRPHTLAMGGVAHIIEDAARRVEQSIMQESPQRHD